MLNNRIAVVSGSSSGIGRAIAVEFARHGADVLVHANCNLEGAEQTAANVRELGREAKVVAADFSTAAGRQNFCDQAWQWKQRIDILVNNAGLDVLTGEASRWSFEQKLDRLFEVDVKATMLIARELGRQMTGFYSQLDDSESAKRQTGLILNVGWDQAATGMEGDSGEMFAATKSAVMGFSRSLARSLAPHVRVNCLAPGWIQTAWGDDASEYWKSRATAESLLGRWGHPEDIAGVAVFLASPAGGFVNGQVIPINGGFRSGATDR